MNRARTLAALGMAAVLATTSGCGGGFTGVYDLPLPGGADLGNRPYRVDVEFSDVADLVPQAAVKVNDVPVGRVSAIALGKDNHTVTVTLSVNRSAVLPANATARLRQSSLLGEKFVDLSPPANEPPEGRLSDGSVVKLDRTAKSTEVEQVLGALSLLLNGGGLEQARTITTELNKALAGNTGHVRSLLSSVHTLASTLDAQKAGITRALDSVAKLSGTLSAQRANITTALKDLALGMKVLTDQRDQLVGLLQAMDRLSGTAVDTINKSQDDLVADLRALAPTLHQLAAAGDALPKSLQLLLTFPFPDAGLDVVKGDYANAKINADLKLDSILANLGPAKPQPVPSAPASGPGAPTAAPPPPLGTAPGPASSLGGPLGGLLGTILGGA
ncbi:MCE family protein [Amycolatopsis orientalis]|uniref:MCE family protein n=1 Tax=Amycolatopsis orientalis TaxID=31958 RepID=UPI0003AA028E|nr:MCE family protein [Amycolatopsis orientalis]